jgi:ketosteroid isomerase-like protein
MLDAALRAADTGRAMSQERVEAVRRFARAFNEGDVDAMVAELDPNVEWEDQPIPGLDPVYHGHEGVRRWAEAVMQELASLQVHIEGVSEAGDAVIVSTRVRAEGRSSGVEVQMHVYQVVTFREDKAARRQVFRTRQEALEAVGLSE